MKVLVLPSNIASMPAITVDRLIHAGVDAKALFIDSNPYQDNKNFKSYQLKNLPYGFPQKFYNLSRFYLETVRAIQWADVIHWCGTFSIPLLKLTLPIIKYYKKPCLVEWVGSDIRIPEVEFADNPYYKAIFHNGYEYAYESMDHSKQIQKMYQQAGFVPLVFPGMEQYILPEIFPEYVKFIQRIDLGLYTPQYPSATNKKPLIVHAPSAPVCKGTSYVEDAVEKLKQKYDLEFILVHKFERTRALDTIRQCDIFVDQLILGSYGMATMEAFAFGKPVMCYMKPSVLECFPGTSPIINTNPDTIYQQLENLLLHPELRNKKGIESRKYAEDYHNIDVVVEPLIKIYEETIRKRKGK